MFWSIMKSRLFHEDLVSHRSHQQSFCGKTPLQTDKSLHTSQGQESHGCKARPWPRVDE